MLSRRTRPENKKSPATQLAELNKAIWQAASKLAIIWSRHKRLTKSSPNRLLKITQMAKRRKRNHEQEFIIELLKALAPIIAAIITALLSK